MKQMQIAENSFATPLNTNPLKGRSIAILAASVAAVVIVGVVFAFNLSPSKPISDAELQKMTEQSAEVKAFLSKYPDPNVQFNRNETIRNIDYFTVVDRAGEPRPFTYLLKINIFTDDSGDIKELTFTCSKTDGIDAESYTISEGIEDDIRNEDCLKL